MEMESSARGAPRRGSRLLSVVGLLVGALVLALVIARGVLEIAYADRVYSGVVVAGIDLGGQTRAQAAATLLVPLQAYSDQPVEILAGDQTLQYTAGELGFRQNAQALAEQAYAAGRQGSTINRLLGPVIASAQADPPESSSSTVDPVALASTVSQIAASVDRPVIHASLTFVPATTLRPSQSGQSLDQTLAREQTRDYLANRRAAPLTLSVQVTEPKVTTGQLEPLRSRAVQIVSSGTALTDGGHRWPLSAGDVASALVIRADGTAPMTLDLKTETLTTLVAKAAGETDVTARDAVLKIDGAKVSVEPDRLGRALDQPATVAALRAGVLDAKSEVVAVVQPHPAAVTTSSLTPLVMSTQAALDRGLVLSVGGQSYPVAGVELASLLAVSPAADAPKNTAPGVTPTIAPDLSRIEQLVARIDARYRHPSPDARFGWENGKVKLLGPTVPGVTIDAPMATATILGAWYADRWASGKAELPTINAPIVLDPALVDRLNQDLQGVIGERSISFAGSIPERANNVTLALRNINGSLVMPGETFSFNRAVGPTTLAAGFQWGFGYSTTQGKSSVVPSVAGGICQVSTTMFQPVFWAGYQIEERHWHMFAMNRYADRGVVGLDATVSPDDGLDFQFTNNTEHALLIVAGTRGQATVITLVGTKPDWIVKVDPEQVTDRTPAPSQVERTMSPLFASGRQIILEDAQGGLTSHVTRHVITPDGHERILQLSSKYLPAARSILVGTG